VSASTSVLTPGSERAERAAAFAAARTHVSVVAVLLVAAGVGWWSTSAQMSGMDAGPGSALGSLGWFVGAWAVMMAAMMLPSLAPTAAVYTHLTRRREPTRPLLFAGGYLLLWSVVGVAAYGVFELGKSLFGAELAWHAGGRWLAASMLALAAFYELSPVKHACLRRCRSPLRFLSGSWRDGRAGAVALGVRTGGWCLGCSWLLMVALFALGVMGLTWMALVAAVVGVEKIGPWRRPVTLAVAAVLLALALALLVAPHEVPGLVVPGGSSAAMHSMGTMH
jgi:predicted metal-binding membrane protein